MRKEEANWLQMVSGVRTFVGIWPTGVTAGINLANLSDCGLRMALELLLALTRSSEV